MIKQKYAQFYNKYTYMIVLGLIAITGGFV